jgi:hypothetical protein
MPYFAASAAIVAGGTATPLSGWQYRQPNFPALLELMVNGSAAGLTHTLTTGSESIIPIDTPISGGGTAGTLPARLNTEAVADGVLSGEEIVHTIKNPSGGTITFNAVYVLSPTKA